METIYSILRGVCLVQCTLFGIYILLNRNHVNTGVNYLGWYLIVGAINFGNVYALQFYPNLIIISVLSSGMFGGLLLIFSSHYFNIYSFNLKNRILLLSLPMLYYTCYYVLEGGNNFLKIQIDVFNTACLLLAFALVMRVPKDRIILHGLQKYNWIRFLLAYSILINISYYLARFLVLNNAANPDLIGTIHFIFLLFFINGIIYTAISSPEVVVNTAELKKRLSAINHSKYDYSDLSKKDADRILKEIDDFIRIKKNYRDSSMSLEKTSKQLGWGTKEISQSINQYLEMNFKEYIGFNRIMEAQDLLSNAEFNDMRINEVMYAVGFSSRSSFNFLFKKYTGFTPRQFKANHHNDSTGETSEGTGAVTSQVLFGPKK